jgi:hypothetical protein
MSEILLDFSSTFKSKKKKDDSRLKQQKFMDRMRKMETEPLSRFEEGDEEEMATLRSLSRRKDAEIDRLRERIKSLEDSNRDKTTIIEKMNRENRKTLRENTKSIEKLQTKILRLTHLQTQYQNTIRRNETMYERLKERSTQMIKSKHLKHGMQIVAKRNKDFLREEDHENVLKKLAESMWSERVSNLSNENKEMRILLKSLLPDNHQKELFLNGDLPFSECVDMMKRCLESSSHSSTTQGQQEQVQKELEEAREIIYEQDQLLQTAIFDDDDDDDEKSSRSSSRRISTPSSDIFALRDMLEQKSRWALEQERIYRENIVPPSTPSDSPLKGIFPTPGTPRTRAILKRIGICSSSTPVVTDITNNH